MDDKFLIGLLLGIVAALLMNVGKGVQKQFVKVFTHGRNMFSNEHRKDLMFWGIGMGMVASATVPFSLGLKFSQSPSSVSAMTGIGLIGLGLYAVYVIGERFGRTDFIGICLVVIGTSLLAYLGGRDSTGEREFVLWLLVLSVAILVAVCVIACIVAKFYQSIHGLAYGGTAGTGIGLAIFLADIALVEADGSFAGQLSNPYPYVALVFAASATVVTQFGFLKSRAIEVVSAVNSATILTPLFLEVVIYGIFPTIGQFVLVSIIVTGVMFLSRGVASKVSS